MAERRPTRRQRMVLAALARGAKLRPVPAAQGSVWRVITGPRLDDAGARVFGSTVERMRAAGWISLREAFLTGTVTITEAGVEALAPRRRGRPDPILALAAAEG